MHVHSVCTKGVAWIGLFDAIQTNMYRRLATFTEVRKLKERLVLREEINDTLRKQNFLMKRKSCAPAEIFFRDYGSRSGFCIPPVTR